MNGVKFLLDTNYVIGLIKEQEDVIQDVRDRSINRNPEYGSAVMQIDCQ